MAKTASTNASSASVLVLSRALLFHPAVAEEAMPAFVSVKLALVPKLSVTEALSRKAPTPNRSTAPTVSPR